MYCRGIGERQHAGTREAQAEASARVTLLSAGGQAMGRAVGPFGTKSLKEGMWRALEHASAI